MVVSCFLKVLFVGVVLSHFRGLLFVLSVSNDEDKLWGNETIFSLYSKDRDFKKTKVIQIALNDNNLDFEFTFDPNFKCNLIKFQNNIVWEKEPGSEYPLGISSNSKNSVKLRFENYSLLFYKHRDGSWHNYGMRKDTPARVENSKSDIDSLSSSKTVTTPSHPTTNKDMAKFHVDLLKKVTKLEDELSSLKYEYEYMRNRMEKVDKGVLEVVEVLSVH